MLLDLADGPIRLFSVDGGHTEQTVFSDMRLAEATLAEGGVVIADDVFNPQWPGVCVGTLRYLDRGGALVPFMIGFNKVLFARSRYCSEYRNAIEAAFCHRKSIDIQSSVLAGHEVGILLRGPGIPVQIVQSVAGSKSARSLYRRVVRRDKRLIDRD